MQRVRTRRLYRLADERMCDSDALRAAPTVTAAAIAAHSGGNLRAGDIEVHDLKIDWGMKAENPVDRVWFFKRGDGKSRHGDVEGMVKQRIEKEKVSMLLPATFRERIIRCYVRESGPTRDVKCEAAHQAMRSWFAAAEGGGRPISPHAHPNSRVWDSPARANWQPKLRLGLEADDDDDDDDDEDGVGVGVGGGAGGAGGGARPPLHPTTSKRRLDHGGDDDGGAAGGATKRRK